MMIGLTALTLVLALGIGGWTLWLGARGDAAAVRPDGKPFEIEDADLVYGLFYANPRDPRGWVPKRVGIGYTVNFRTARTARCYAAVLVATLLSASALSVFALAAGR